MTEQVGTYIELRDANGNFNMTCQYCGQRFETAQVMGQLVSDGHDIGEMCLDCLAAGPAGMAQRMRENAERKRDYVAWLEEVAEEIAGRQAGEWPSMAEWQRRSERLDGMVRGDIDFYDGACPECGHEEYLNIYRAQWGVCREHGVKWQIGHNAYSSWRQEDEDIWTENERLLADFAEVEPVYSVAQVKRPPDPAQYASRAYYLRAYGAWHEVHKAVALWAPVDACEAWEEDEDDLPF